MKKQLTYISLFSSAGVGCFGFKQNDFKCIATNEILTKRLNIQTYNNKCKYQSGYIDGDISTKQIKNKLFTEIELWKDKHKIKEPDVVIATPPCQGMSVANHKKNNEKSRNSLVVESIKIIKEVSPKIFIFENVRAFLNTVCTDIDGVDKPISEAIKLNLGGNYNILSRVINFKEYGSNSSRTRTLILGLRKDLQSISPYDIFPKKKKAKTLRQLIGDLPALTTMGEISEDIFHSYREFEGRMLPWIEDLKEGQSAFENTDVEKIPHRIIDGIKVRNKSKNGDKYSRWYWNKEGPCVHTRNDILSSQNTVHPSDNRVFSIRELMRMMTIPEKFEWSSTKANHLNKKSFLEKKLFLKKEELNIRHCIGEAVPTGVFESIAFNIKTILSTKNSSISEINKIIDEHELSKAENLLNFIGNKFKQYKLDDLLLIAELSNSQRQKTSAFFTRKDIAYTVIKELPIFKKKKKIRILEPSVGVGNFLPLLFEKYSDKSEVILDVYDIDNNSIKVLKAILNKIKVPINFKINIHNADFLLCEIKHKYDLVVGNPPYKKLTGNKGLLAKYKCGAINTETNNLFSFFIDKSINLGDYVSLIVPKSVLSSPEFNQTRELFSKYNLEKICDYGEKGFKGVKIETVSFLLNTNYRLISDKVVVESYINNSYKIQSKEYLFAKEFPSWLLYRNDGFDNLAAKMNLGVFQSFRDRQITKSITKENGKVRVLKARNIGNNEIKDLDNYDKYVDEYTQLTVAKYINKSNVVMVPNLTYYPRASFLPKNTIVDGSVALLTLKNGSRLPTKKDLGFYSTKEFEKYYRIARNHGTRSLNIDNNSVFFFGLLKK